MVVSAKYDPVTDFKKLLLGSLSTNLFTCPGNDDIKPYEQKKRHT